MKTNCSKPAGAWSLAIAVGGLILILWPAAGQCQRSRQAVSEPAPASDPNAAAPANSWASFDIILQRNIFSRQRRPVRRQETVVERPVRPAPNPESYYLLRGVVQENDDFIAFIEDTQTSTVLRLRRGDPVARGTIKTLTLDGLEYQMEDKTTVVHLGRDLEGGHGNLTASQMMDFSAMPASSPTGQPSQTTPTTPPSGAEADILKRLMEQRRQQLGQ